LSSKFYLFRTIVITQLRHATMKLRSSQPKRTQSEASNANVVKTSKRAQAKKRKTQEGEDHTESMRGGGLLNDIMEMPMDVLFEVFFLPPLYDTGLLIGFLDIWPVRTS
jgi:hypothetical protein